MPTTLRLLGCDGFDVLARTIVDQSFAGAALFAGDYQAADGSARRRGIAADAATQARAGQRVAAGRGSRSAGSWARRTLAARLMREAAGLAEGRPDRTSAVGTDLVARRSIHARVLHAHLPARAREVAAGHRSTRATGSAVRAAPRSGPDRAAVPGQSHGTAATTRADRTTNGPPGGSARAAPASGAHGAAATNRAGFSTLAAKASRSATPEPRHAARATAAGFCVASGSSAGSEGAGTAV